MFTRFSALLMIGAMSLSLLPVSHAYEGTFFLVSAYYSPLPDQSYYLHGNYETEIRVNGRGTHGASGQAVRPGMIAAPKNYPFGAKIALEGIGVGTVLDRGGAIVEADKSGSFTRLDVYMGAGEEGLCRAKKFGIKTVYGTAFTLEESKQIEQDTIEFSHFPSDCDFVTGGSSSGSVRHSEVSHAPAEPSLRQKVLTQAVTPSSPKGDIAQLKALFDEVGYLIGRINNDYDTNMTNTIYRFQVSQGIIEGPYDEGAGYYGPKTRAALTDVLYSGDSEDNNSSVNESEKRSEVVVQAQISIFDTRINSQASEDDVRELQFILRQIGYFDHDQDGRFNKRLVDAIFDFQVDYDIVDSEFDEGAGYYGPKTRSKLKEVYGVFQERQDQIRDLQTQLVGIQNDRAELLASKKAEFQARLDAMGDLQQGVTSAQVRDLQILLRELGYLDHKDTAIFGPLTQQALAKYQLELGKIESIHSQYAGILGSVTRAAIIDDLTRRFEQSDTTYIDTMKEIQGEIQELKDI